MTNDARTLPVARMLPWDTAHFGVPIGRLQRPILDGETADELAVWMAANGAACVYCLFAAEDATSPRIATVAGARLTDVRMTFELDRRIARPTADIAPRRARLDDLPSLETLAASAHYDSRFYVDPRFDRSRADELYRLWIRKSIEGSLADGAVTFDHQGQAAGYVTFSGPTKTGTPGLGEIGLVAIHESARGRGAASRLLYAALDALVALGTQRIRVVTQGRNSAAQRLYQRAGFVTKEVELWFHLWARTDPASGIR